jgi:two-component system sensor kinase FixL
MGQKLRVLIVEDNERDAALLVRELKQGGYDLSFERVDTPEAMGAALDGQSWDLVISDYSMPRFSGPRALDLVRKTQLDLPFIIVSGTVSEKIAVESMRAGARDFMAKGEFHRLLPAIERELRETALRAEHRAMKDHLDEMRAQMLHVARLNAMGEMVGTLAHELNQPLMAITNYVNTARRRLQREASADPRVDEVLIKVSDQVLRVGQIIARVRSFLIRGETKRQDESLSALVEEAADLSISAAAKSRVDLRFEFDRGADRVLVDRGQVQQVLMNLIRNALEAMAALERPRLTITTRAIEDDLVEVCVADAGPGLAPEVAQRLFQPFVTSKPDGMGVGLAISRNITESHGGRMWSGANAEGGANFHFTLKRADALAGCS